MSLLVPGTNTTLLHRKLLHPNDCLIICFCATWCDICQQYRPNLQALAHRLPQHRFFWVDIEEHPELLGDEDIETFPTLLVQIGARVVFFGSMLPHIKHLERLLNSLSASSTAISTTLPANLHQLLST
jgi:thiol-disulfide isomerase/thioredoxin